MGKWVIKVWDRAGDWVNFPLYKWGNNHELRRIDVVLILGGCALFAYGFYYASWIGGIQVLAGYAMMVMIGLWFL
jgi:hypothetical protein